MTSQERKVFEQALEALEREARGYAVHDELQIPRSMRDAIVAINEALAQPEQIPPSVYSNTHQPEPPPECPMDSYGDGNVYRGQRSKDSVVKTITLAQPEQCRKEKHKNGEYVCNCKAGECPQFAQPEQEPVAWKLMPKEPTEEMLKAMDECSTEGYDERLYAGHAASVYMAAWDEAPTPPQPERYITDAMKVRQAVAQALLDDVYAEELEQPEAKQSGTISITMPAPIAYLCENATGHKYFRWKKPSSVYKPTPLYTTPPQPEQEPCDMGKMCIGCSPRNADGSCPDAQQEPVACQHKRYSIDVHEQIGNCLDCGAEGRMRFIVGTPQRTWEGLSVSEINDLVENTKYKDYRGLVATTEAKLKDKNT